MVLQLAQVGARLFRCAHIRFADDLHQRHARAVEIDEGQRRMLVVHRLAGILLQMQPRHANGADRTSLQLDLDDAAFPRSGGRTG